MHEVVLYGVGSPIVVDIEESLARAGITIAAAVQNVDGEIHLLDPARVITPVNVTDRLTQLPFMIPLFTPGHRQAAAAEASRQGFRTAFSLIDPSAVMPRAIQAGPGLYINAGCCLGAACELADFVFINRGVCLGHHARLERFVSIGPGAVVGSLVHVEAGALIGAGAVVLPKVRVCPNAVVGAGAVVTKNVPAHCQVVGNPARIVRDDIIGYNDLKVA